METEQNCNILTPTLMVISVSFPFSRAAQPGAWGPTSLGAGFLYRILSPTRLIYKPLEFLCTELYDSSTPTQSLPITGHRNMHFRRLWNGMFDRHRADITVMQFTGHSLPVHQFVTVPWDFNPVPYCQSNSPTPMEHATSAVFGMACLDGSEVNILPLKLQCVTYLKWLWNLLKHWLLNHWYGK